MHKRIYYAIYEETKDGVLFKGTFYKYIECCLTELVIRSHGNNPVFINVSKKEMKKRWKMKDGFGQLYIETMKALDEKLRKEPETVSKLIKNKEEE